jgi:hypothetical protein
MHSSKMGFRQWNWSIQFPDARPGVAEVPGDVASQSFVVTWTFPIVWEILWVILPTTFLLWFIRDSIDCFSESRYSNALEFITEKPLQHTQ